MKTVLRKAFEAAIGLLEQSAGDTEFARRLWNDVFKEAERIDHDQSLGEPDEIERAYMELTERFEQAKAARSKFHVVKDEGATD